MNSKQKAPVSDIPEHTAKKYRKILENSFKIWILGAIFYTLFLMTFTHHLDIAQKNINDNFRTKDMYDFNQDMRGDLHHFMNESQANQVVELQIEGKCPFNPNSYICKTYECEICQCDDQMNPLEWEYIKDETNIIELYDIKQNLGSSTTNLPVDSFLHGFPIFSSNKIWTTLKQDINKQIKFDNSGMEESEQQLISDIYQGFNLSIDTYMLYNKVKFGIQNPQKLQTRPAQKNYFQEIGDFPYKVELIYEFYLFYSEIMKEILSSNKFTYYLNDNYFQQIKHKYEQHELFFLKSEQSKFVKMLRSFQKHDHFREKFEQITKHIVESAQCFDCEICKGFIIFQYEGLLKGLNILTGYSVEELSINDMNIILNQYETIVETLHYTDTMYYYKFNYSKSMGATLFSTTLCFMAFFKIHIRNQNSAKTQSFQIIQKFFSQRNQS